MSMVVYFRPLSSDDGAEVPLDLHDPRIRLYPFKARINRGDVALWDMFKDYFGWALSTKRQPKLKDFRGMVFFYFGGQLEDPELDELAQMAAHHMRNGPPEGEPTKLMRMAAHHMRNGPPEGEPTKLMRMAAHHCHGLEPTPKNEPIIPIALLAIPDGRWVERRFCGLRGKTWKEDTQDGKRLLVAIQEIDERYREVNRHFAAFLWQLDGLEPPGKLPSELEPYRVVDWTKIPDEALYKDFLSDEDLAYVAACHELDESLLRRACRNSVSLNPYARTEPLPEAQAYRPELVTAAPSGNGTTATNGRPTEALTDRIELAAAEWGADQEDAEKLLFALREMGAVDEAAAAKKGCLRRETDLSEREYRKAMKLLKAEKAVQAKPGVGTWLTP